MLKRSLDIAISAFLLLLAAPIIALAALLIVLESPGPVLFRQHRMGRGHRRFELLKLRTMRHMMPGTLYTLGADPRITLAGRWLRMFKLDELPQLWNVLRGDMSLVGPRPVLPALTWEFNAEYARLLMARPGLTDPASIRYCREAELLATASDPLDVFKTIITPDKLRLSLAYMERATVWSDIWVMARTAVSCFAPNLAGARVELPMMARRSTMLLTMRPRRVAPKDTRYSVCDEETCRVKMPTLPAMDAAGD